MELALKVLAIVTISVVAINYKYFWYYTQFWITPALRRPYTFLIRDFYHDHPIAVLFGILYLGYALHNWLSFSTMVAIGIGTILGHLFWGAKYVPGQQEEDTFNPSS